MNNSYSNYSPRPRNGSNRSRFSRGETNNPRRPSHFMGSRGRGKQPKKLDPTFFVSAASGSVVENTYVSQTPFASFPIPEQLKKNIIEHGYTMPTEIQEKTIPPLLEGKDVIGIANTGTGKTAAFLIPLISKVYADRNEQVLIVTPTREIAMQILDELNIFARGMGLYATLCIGGANIGRQERNLQHRPQFVIGTPGRLKDLIQRRKLYLDTFRSIVLDEVDRMVDIGFIKDIRFLIALLPEQRHSLFFSATVSDEVRSILHSFVKNPVTVSVKQQETSRNVEQDIIRVTDPTQKVDMLHDLLIKDGFDKVLIFGRTKWGVEKLTKMLQTRGFKAASIHGNKSQGQRARALDDFKRNNIQILLATDVASRGLDIDNVTHVINYDTPESYEDYVHRIGRTGRANKTGVALTFVE
jgi:ATP-dependent RNA helicase RhlE